MVKKFVGLVLAILLMVIAFCAPVPEGLTREGFIAIIIPVFTVVLWVFETVPPAVTSLLIIVFVPLLGLMSQADAYKNFGLVTVFFALAASSLTVLFAKSSIPYRLVNRLVKWAKGDKNKFVFGFLVATAFFSAFMSDMLTTLLMLGVARPLLDNLEVGKGKSRLGKCLMIGIPAAGMIGGMATPVGSVINILAMGIVSSTTGVDITFIQWMLAGIPCTIIVLATFSICLLRICKPEDFSAEDIKIIEAQTHNEGGLSLYEKKVILFTVVLFVLWILGSFITVLNTTIVAIIALFVMFLPGVDMMTWKEFAGKGVPWNVILIFGAVGVFIAPFTATGASTWVANLLVGATAGMSGLMLAVVFAAFIVILNAFIPLGTASAAIFSAPFALVAAASGAVSPVTVAMIVGMGSAVTLFIPQNVCHFLSLDDGYYTTSDCMKVGAIPTIVMILALAVVPFLMFP